LYASLAYLNKLDRKIITVEDPVEITIDGVVQGMLNPKVHQTYMDFIKAMMRQDPDVIMIGEIRDKEVAQATVQAGLTGHKVFSTFHTEDSVAALLRLIDMGIDPFLVSSTITAVLAQRLVRVVCPHCRKTEVPRDEVLAFFQLKEALPAGVEFYRGDGCLECNFTGFRGRTGIHELLVINDPIRNTILAKNDSSEIRTLARARGSGLP
jgi:type II secretory ATPase GspE/PulE/Tfp pilus assembly ATPase PilB-like protein